MFEVLASSAAVSDPKLVEALCRQIAFPSRPGNIALAKSLLERVDDRLVHAFLSEQTDDAFLWITPSKPLNSTCKYWPAVISPSSSLEVRLFFVCVVVESPCRTDLSGCLVEWI